MVLAAIASTTNFAGVVVAWHLPDKAGFRSRLRAARPLLPRGSIRLLPQPGGFESLIAHRVLPAPHDLSITEVANNE